MGSDSIYIILLRVTREIAVRFGIKGSEPLIP
jgi:hypothetical protein